MYAGLCMKARLACFFCSIKKIDFLNCVTKTSNCFKCEHKAFRVRDVQMHMTGKKQDCETQEMEWKLYETRFHWRNIYHSSFWLTGQKMKPKIV